MEQEEKSKYIKVIEERWNSLEEGERQIIGLGMKNIDHKRAFLSTTMTISVAIIAGLFVLISQNNNCLNLLAIINCIFFISFLIISSIYFIVILSQESLFLDKKLKFVRESKQNFIENISNGTIKDIDSYEGHRKKKYKEEKEPKQEIKGSSEIWFILINALFIFSIVLLFITFLLVNF